MYNGAQRKRKEGSEPLRIVFSVGLFVGIACGSLKKCSVF
jgi:hypothetical protein